MAPADHTARLIAPCKVNLLLKVLDRRESGYHDIFSLFLPLPEPADVLTVSGADEEGLRLTCDVPGLENDNILHRAYEAYARKTGFRPGLCVHLEKRVPMGAGLGGGSSDAATLLRHLDTLAGKTSLTPEELSRLALDIGADVPFFLFGRPALARGLGEDLTPSPIELRGIFLVLVCPRVHISTAWAYTALDELRERDEALPPSPAILTALGEKFTRPFCPEDAALENDFEAVVLRAHPALRNIRDGLRHFGAFAAVMSGSGSSILGLFRDPDSAWKAKNSFREHGEIFLIRF